MLGFSLLLHASPIGCKKNKMWHQGCWNDKQCPILFFFFFFTGFLIKPCQKSHMMKTLTLKDHISAVSLHLTNIF